MEDQMIARCIQQLENAHKRIIGSDAKEAAHYITLAIDELKKQLSL